MGHLLILDGIEEGVNGAVALAGYLKNSIGVLEGAPEGDMGMTFAINVFRKGVLEQLVGLLGLDVLLLEQLKEYARG